MMKSVGIVDIATYVPGGRLDLRAEAQRFDADEKFIREKTGFTTVARRRSDQDCSDLAIAAIEALLSDRPELKERIGLLIVVTQNPDGYGLPHVSALIQGRLGLPDNIAAFDISLGCSGWVYGLSVAKSFMEANGIEHGILVTSDPYSKVLDPDDRNTMLLFGDAATATLLGRTDVRWLPGKFVFGTDGTRADSLRVDNGRRLRMKGREIFTFSATRVPKCIDAVLAANEQEINSIDVVVLHQGSRYIVDTIGKRIGASEKTVFLDNGIGNTVSSTIPMLLSSGECDDAKTTLVCGFGVGLSWAATILKSELDV
jgi:3-oxoacyl-[acyl-carrier-protein] synthase III